MSKMEVNKSLRYRINVSRGMKGGVSFEATVDGENYEMDEVLAKSDELVKKLKGRYPVQMEVK